MIPGVVRRGVARPQDRGEGLTGRIREAEHRMEPEPAFVSSGPCPSLFSEWTSISDASMSNTIGVVPVVAEDRAHTVARVAAVAACKPMNVYASS